MAKPVGAEQIQTKIETVAGTYFRGKRRSNPNWGLLDYPGPLAGIMARTWDCAEGVQFARRRIFDARLAFTLQHYGITHFYTQNVKDFRDLGFQEVIDPLA